MSTQTTNAADPDPEDPEEFETKYRQVVVDLSRAISPSGDSLHPVRSITDIIQHTDRAIDNAGQRYMAVLVQEQAAEIARLNAEAACREACVSRLVDAAYQRGIRDAEISHGITPDDIPEPPEQFVRAVSCGDGRVHTIPIDLDGRRHTFNARATPGADPAVMWAHYVQSVRSALREVCDGRQTPPSA